MRNNKTLIFLCIEMLHSYCLANQQYTFTTCVVQRGVYVHIDQYHLHEDKIYKDISKPTNFQIIDKPTGETYSLVVEKADKKQTIHIYYSGEYFLWNTKEREYENKAKLVYTNDLPNLVFKIIDSKFNYEQTYYFNLDTQGNGFMSVINIRYNNPFGNNQSLFFCSCKGS